MERGEDGTGRRDRAGVRGESVWVGDDTAEGEWQGGGEGDGVEGIVTLSAGIGT